MVGSLSKVNVDDLDGPARGKYLLIRQGHQTPHEPAFCVAGSGGHDAVGSFRNMAHRVRVVGLRSRSDETNAGDVAGVTLRIELAPDEPETCSFPRFTQAISIYYCWFITSAAP